MSSPAAINRANAQHSTGPRTPEGKHRASLNAIRHGLTGQIVVMPSEDLHAYKRHIQSFTDEYKPANATESQLVQSLADAAWRLNRVAALESNILSLSVQGEDALADTMAIAAAFAFPESRGGQATNAWCRGRRTSSCGASGSLRLDSPARGHVVCAAPVCRSAEAQS